jgi:hypothetical protein
LSINAQNITEALLHKLIISCNYIHVKNDQL